MKNELNPFKWESATIESENESGLNTLKNVLYAYNNQSAYGLDFCAD